MFTFFDEYDLLELFNAEPITTGPEGTGLYIYSKNNSNGVKIVLSLSAHEHKCSISLGIDGVSFFQVELKNVEYLRRKDGYLRIHQSNSDDDYSICFYPEFFFRIGDDRPV